MKAWYTAVPGPGGAEFYGYIARAPRGEPAPQLGCSLNVTTKDGVVHKRTVGTVRQTMETDRFTTWVGLFTDSQPVIPKADTTPRCHVCEGLAPGAGYGVLHEGKLVHPRCAPGFDAHRGRS